MAPPALGFDARVEVVEQLGSEILLETRVGPDSVTVARVPAETKVARGDQVRISAQLGRLHFFDPQHRAADFGVNRGKRLCPRHCEPTGRADAPPE